MPFTDVYVRQPAWAWLNRVEGGESRRTGPSRTMIQDVPLEVGHVYVFARKSMEGPSRQHRVSGHPSQ